MAEPDKNTLRTDYNPQDLLILIALSKTFNFWLQSAWSRVIFYALSFI